VELISRALINSRLGRTLTAKMKEYLGRSGARRLQWGCIILLVGMLVGDVILLFRAGERPRAAPHYSAIRPAVTAGGQQRRPPVKAFGEVWDSLMADPVRKNSWDSLLRLRPGLRDTVRELERMDSAVSGR
jgi:hypothetical protein